MSEIEAAFKPHFAELRDILAAGGKTHRFIGRYRIAMGPDYIDPDNTRIIVIRRGADYDVAIGGYQSRSHTVQVPTSTATRYPTSALLDAIHSAEDVFDSVLFNTKRSKPLFHKVIYGN